MVAVQEPRWVRVEDARVPVLDVGNPGGRALVLVPGLTDGLAPVTARVAQQLFSQIPLPTDRHRALVLSHAVPSRPGVGTRLLAARLREALDQLLEGPAVLVAHSLGGMVAQQIAAQAPDQVAGLVLSATAGRSDARLRAVLARWDRWLVNGEHDRFRVDAIRTSVTGTAREHHLALHAAAPQPAPTPAAVARHLVLSAACSGHDATSVLPHIRAPALVLAGGRDQVVSPQASELLAQELSDSTFEVYEDLGHGFPEQARGPFQARVSRFLGDLGW